MISKVNMMRKVANKRLTGRQWLDWLCTWINIIFYSLLTWHIHRSPIVGSISGAELTGAAHRLIISNNMENISNQVNQETNSLQQTRQQTRRPAVKKPIKKASACEGSLIGVPPFSSRRTRPPAGPPGYEHGFSRSQVRTFALMFMKKVEKSRSHYCICSITA